MRNTSLRKHLPLVMTAMLGVVASFGAGMRLSADVQTVPATSAQDTVLGDMDQSGDVNQVDVEILLQIAQGNREATAEQLRADPNQDGKLTVEDAMRLLKELP